MQKGTKHTLETKQKISQKGLGRKMSVEFCINQSSRLKGNTYARGFKHTLETRRKVSEGLKGNKHTLGRKLSEEHKKNIGLAGKGRIVSIETRNKLSIANRNKPTGKKGWHHSEEAKKKIGDRHRGAKNSNWKGGITSENVTIRTSTKMIEWRNLIYQNNDFTCQKTGIKGGRLVAHHIQNFAQYPELRFDINNGITLSYKAHREFHKIYGLKFNTREQIEEFLDINTSS